jgi:Plasmid encoded RepA protein
VARRRQAVTKHERMVIEAAYQVLSDDAEKLGFTYSGFALTSLPHKPQAELVWKREGHNLTMLIQSGVDRTGRQLGLPYGSYARFILLFLQSEAIRTGSREIELGRSMRVWLGCMGLSIGGTTYRLVNEQARRISGCSLTFYADRAGAQIESRGGFVKTAISMSNVIDEQPALWQDRVLLDEDFFRALRDHPVPLSESALRAIGPRSLVIDIYIWLAYRLHALKRDVEVGWPALYAQFGAGVGRPPGLSEVFYRLPCPCHGDLSRGSRRNRPAWAHPAAVPPGHREGVLAQIDSMGRNYATLSRNRERPSDVESICSPSGLQQRRHRPRHQPTSSSA